MFTSMLAALNSRHSRHMFNINYSVFISAASSQHTAKTHNENSVESICELRFDVVTTVLYPCNTAFEDANS